MKFRDIKILMATCVSIEKFDNLIESYYAYTLFLPLTLAEKYTSRLVRLTYIILFFPWLPIGTIISMPGIFLIMISIVWDFVTEER